MKTKTADGPFKARPEMTDRATGHPVTPLSAWRVKSQFLSLILCLLALASATPSVKAQNSITFNFTGVITSVDDALGWFQNTYEVGVIVTGSYTFFATNHLKAVDFSDPDHTATYQYYFKPNFPEVSLTNPDFRLKAGDREIRKDTSLFGWDFFWIPIWNDSAQSFPGAGDGYGVTSAIGFPDFWRDFSGDPVADPDGVLYPLPIANLRLYDPTSNALNSVALPLMPPNLAAFSERSGSIFISDGNGEPDYATATFRITSLTLLTPPALTIARAGPNAVVQWPTNFAGLSFTLQSTTNLLSPTVWTTVSPAPDVVSGQQSVTNSVSGTQKFYRLIL